jgi:ABC-type nitrate/sulfonate/bicarbonate transport system substrate-binding protein
VTARDAFVQGRLDAIVATDPLYSQIASKVSVRVLASPGKAFSNKSVYWGRTDVVNARSEQVRALLDALIASDAKTLEDPRESASLLDGLNGNSAAEWLPALTVRPWSVTAPDAAFLAEQQQHADIFAKFGLLQRQIDVSPTVDASLLAAA